MLYLVTGERCRCAQKAHELSEMHARPEVFFHPFFDNLDEYKLQFMSLQCAKAASEETVIIVSNDEVIYNALRANVAKGRLAKDEVVIFYVTPSNRQTINLDEKGIPSKAVEGFFTANRRLLGEIFLAGMK